MRRCAVCGKPKAVLRGRRSKVLVGVKMLACEMCISAGMEPRSFLILAARRPDSGPDAIKVYLQKHLYVGPDILASDLV